MKSWKWYVIERWRCQQLKENLTESNQLMDVSDTSISNPSLAIKPFFCISPFDSSCIHRNSILPCAQKCLPLRSTCSWIFHCRFVSMNCACIFLPSLMMVYSKKYWIDDEKREEKNQIVQVNCCCVTPIDFIKCNNHGIRGGYTFMCSCMCLSFFLQFFFFLFSWLNGMWAARLGHWILWTVTPWPIQRKNLQAHSMSIYSYTQLSSQRVSRKFCTTFLVFSLKCRTLSYRYRSELLSGNVKFWKCDDCWEFK